MVSKRNLTYPAGGHGTGGHLRHHRDGTNLHISGHSPGRRHTTEAARQATWPRPTPAVTRRHRATLASPPQPHL